MEAQDGALGGCSRRLSWLSLTLWLCPRPAAQPPAASGRLGAEPTLFSRREQGGVPEASLVRAPEPPDPSPEGRGTGAAGEGPAGLQLELLRTALWQAAAGAPGCCPGTRNFQPWSDRGSGHAE